MSTIAIILAATMLPTTQALAGWTYWNASDGTDVPVTNGVYTYWTHQRTIAYASYGIWMKETSGPPILGGWYGCGGSGGSGPVVSTNQFQSSGVYLKDNYSYPYSMTFCLAFAGDGASGSFTGSLNWDGN